jgi:hypothetical protein
LSRPSRVEIDRSILQADLLKTIAAIFWNIYWTPPVSGCTAERLILIGDWYHLDRVAGGKNRLRARALQHPRFTPKTVITRGQNLGREKGCVSKAADQSTEITKCNLVNGPNLKSYNQ